MSACLKLAATVAPLTIREMGFSGTQPVVWAVGRVNKAGELATGALFSRPADTLQQRVLFTFALPSLHEQVTNAERDSAMAVITDRAKRMQRSSTLKCRCDWRTTFWTVIARSW